MDFRANDYREDLMGQNPSMPATAGIFTGAGATPQVTSGVTYADPYDDRSVLVGDADDPAVLTQRSMVLPAETIGGITDGVNPMQGDSIVTPHGNVPNTDSRPGGVIVQSQPGGWYDTLRPHAGWMLRGDDDTTYAAITGDQAAADPYGLHDPFLVTPGVRFVPEKPLDMPVMEIPAPGGSVTFYRHSIRPSLDQEPVNQWGGQLGEWTWSGEKDAQERPIANAGPWFTAPLRDRVPSPTGAGGAMASQFQLAAQPMTFRAPPSPWDVGMNEDNGYYVDGGI